MPSRSGGDAANATHWCRRVRGMPRQARRRTCAARPPPPPRPRPPPPDAHHTTPRTAGCGSRRPTSARCQASMRTSTAGRSRSAAGAASTWTARRSTSCWRRSDGSHSGGSSSSTSSSSSSRSSSRSMGWPALCVVPHPGCSVAAVCACVCVCVCVCVCRWGGSHLDGTVSDVTGV
jgi:hypothetical protein